jgi:hypothetical protein
VDHFPQDSLASAVLGNIERDKSLSTGMGRGASSTAHDRRDCANVGCEKADAAGRHVHTEKDSEENAEQQNRGDDDGRHPNRRWAGPQHVRWQTIMGKGADDGIAKLQGLPLM